MNILPAYVKTWRFEIPHLRIVVDDDSFNQSIEAHVFCPDSQEDTDLLKRHK